MAKSFKPTDWYNRPIEDASFIVSDDFFQALDHIPNPAKTSPILAFINISKKYRRAAFN